MLKVDIKRKERMFKKKPVAYPLENGLNFVNIL